MTPTEEKLIIDRIMWLRDKLAAQRDPESQEFTRNQRLIGITEGNIGALEWALRELKKNND